MGAMGQGAVQSRGLCCRVSAPLLCVSLVASLAVVADAGPAAAEAEGWPARPGPPASVSDAPNASGVGGARAAASGPQTREGIPWASLSERVRCSIVAAVKFSVPTNVMLAVAELEAGAPGQWVRNRNGSYDVGPMQFNTAYLEQLQSQYGITPEQVAQSGCYAYELAAWRISRHIKRDMGNFWRRVANYHSRTPEHNEKYRLRVMRRAERWAGWLAERFATVVIPQSLALEGAPRQAVPVSDDGQQQLAAAKAPRSPVPNVVDRRVTATSTAESRAGRGAARGGRRRRGPGEQEAAGRAARPQVTTREPLAVERGETESTDTATGLADSALMQLVSAASVEPGPLPEDQTAELLGLVEQSRDAYGGASSLGGVLDSWSVGSPHAGSLQGAERLPADRAYRIRNPRRAFATHATVQWLQRGFAELLQDDPTSPVLYVLDLSAEHGGPLSGHRSHQSGRDVDLAYYHDRCGGLCRQRRLQPAQLDAPRQWRFLKHFLRRGQLEFGFIDYRLQQRLYRAAAADGATRVELARWFQYPRGQDFPAGVLRHVPRHRDHMHLRFVCPAEDKRCRPTRLVAKRLSVPGRPEQRVMTLWLSEAERADGELSELLPGE